MDCNTENAVFDCYVAYLFLWSTILATCIEVTTVEKYIGVISKLAKERKVPDLTRDMFGVKAPSTKAHIADAKR